MTYELPCPVGAELGSGVVESDRLLGEILGIVVRSLAHCKVSLRSIKILRRTIVLEVDGEISVEDLERLRQISDQSDEDESETPVRTMN